MLGAGGAAPYKTAWDNATNLLHDIDNATGIRVANLNGDQWIAYGDAQYFIESNRINRLKRSVSFRVNFRRVSLTVTEQY